MLWEEVKSISKGEKQKCFPPKLSWWPYSPYQPQKKEVRSHKMDPRGTWAEPVSRCMCKCYELWEHGWCLKISFLWGLGSAGLYHELQLTHSGNMRKLMQASVVECLQPAPDEQWACGNVKFFGPLGRPTDEQPDTERWVFSMAASGWAQLLVQQALGSVLRNCQKHYN